ncbi:MAG: Octaprenyl diphosphate synthase [Calditrichaeota bacterium]|nr:Octaprenyl diphosphate synthase [Calditrichota bacterium]
MKESERIRLREVLRPIRGDLKAFRRQFREVLRSGIFVVDQVAAHLVRSRGKGLRPALTLLSARASGAQGPLPERTLVAALVVEMLHTATLVHDDVVDRADERRGRPTLNLVYNNKVAVLFGDFMLARSLQGMLAQRKLEVLDLFSDCAIRLSRGELVEAISARKLDMDKAGYFQMVGDKTASLISAACQMGPLSLDRGEAFTEPLAKYGELVGVAYQIRDDLLDLGDGSKRIGKPIGLDLGQAKVTLPLLHALEQLGTTQRAHVLRALRRSKKRDKRGKRTDLREVRAMIEEHGGIDYAREIAHEYSGRAREVLEALPRSEYRDRLAQFARFAATRDR